MNEQPAGSVTGKDPIEYPPLTVLPVEGDPDHFYVLGESGWWYYCFLPNDSRPASCECPHRQYRGAVCKHLTAVAAYIAAGLLERAAKEISEWKAMTEEQRKAVFA